MTRRQQSLEERYANITRQMLAGTLGGRARAAAPVSAPLAALSTTRPRQAGGAGKELATVVVAAADSHASGIASANYACDGVADEIEINQAIADIAALGGGRVILLEGTFVLSMSDTNQIAPCSNCTIQGQGPATVLKADGAAIASFYMISEYSDALPDAKTDVVIRDLTFDGNDVHSGGESVWGVVLESGLGSSHWTIEKCRFIGAMGYGVVGAADYIRVIESDFALDNDWSHAAVTMEGDFALVSNNVVTASGTVDFDAATFGIDIEGNHAEVTGNVISDTDGVGIISHGDYVMIVGNVIDGTQPDTGDGIYVNGSFCNVVGNIISGAGFTGIQLGNADMTVVAYNVIDAPLYDGIRLDTGSTECVVRGNLIHNASAGYATTFDGIFLNSNVDRCNVQANVVRDDSGMTRYGINISAATCDDNLVTNNDVRNGYATAGINDSGTGTITAAGNRL